MSSGTIFLLLLLLACPLMMVWMMRGGHGHGHGVHGGSGHDHSKAEEAEPSLDELRRRRDEIDRLIEEQEPSERETVGAGSRQATSGDLA